MKLFLNMFLFLSSATIFAEGSIVDPKDILKQSDNFLGAPSFAESFQTSNSCIGIQQDCSYACNDEQCEESCSTSDMVVEVTAVDKFKAIVSTKIIDQQSHEVKSQWQFEVSEKEYSLNKGNFLRLALYKSIASEERDGDYYIDSISYLSQSLANGEFVNAAKIEFRGVSGFEIEVFNNFKLLHVDSFEDSIEIPFTMYLGQNVPAIAQVLQSEITGMAPFLRITQINR